MTRAGGRKPSTAEPSSTTTQTGQKGNGAIRGDLAPKVEGRRSSAFPRLEHEHFVEEPWVSRRLIEYLGIDAELRWGRGAALLDPAAGFGHIVRSARALGLTAFGTDLVKRSAGVGGGRDFLDPGYSPPRAEGPLSIFCNPPFGLLRQFTEKALALADDRVAILTHARRLAAARWLESLPLARILYVTPRPSMWPGFLYRQRVEAGLPLGAGREDFCWLVFEVGRAYRGEAGWLRRDGEGR